MSPDTDSSYHRLTKGRRGLNNTEQVQEEKNMVDQVKVVADDQAPAEQSLRRNLTNRHIQLIAIGGAIGTGVVYGVGKDD